MAITVGGNTGRRSRGAPPLAEINVTPFVDVVLVLLIIFMITAHAMESGVEVEVPKTRTVAATTKELPIVTINKASEIFLGKDPIRLDDLPAQIHSRYPGQTAVYVKADRETNWDVGVQVMNVLGTAKFGINVVSQLDERRR
jgi:biopolymer transport protein ExbD